MAAIKIADNTLKSINYLIFFCHLFFSSPLFRDAIDLAWRARAGDHRQSGNPGLPTLTSGRVSGERNLPSSDYPSSEWRRCDTQFRRRHWRIGAKGRQWEWSLSASSVLAEGFFCTRHIIILAGISVFPPPAAGAGCWRLAGSGYSSSHPRPMPIWWKSRGPAR